MLPPDTPKLVTAGAMPDLSETFMRSPSREPEDGSTLGRAKRRKSTKGWDGEDLSHSTLRRAQMTDVSGGFFFFFFSSYNIKFGLVSCPATNPPSLFFFYVVCDRIELI